MNDPEPQDSQPRRVIVTPDDVTLSPEGAWANTYTRERIRRGQESERVYRRGLSIDEACAGMKP